MASTLGSDLRQGGSWEMLSFELELHLETVDCAVPCRLRPRLMACVLTRRGAGSAKGSLPAAGRKQLNFIVDFVLQPSLVMCDLRGIKSTQDFEDDSGERECVRVCGRASRVALR